MKLSIVIPSYNMASRLAQGLRHLAALQSCQGAELEVVVVDDGSSDETSQVLRAAEQYLPELRHVHRPRDGQSCRSKARNIGIELSRGEFIIFLDAGVMLTRNFFEATCARLQKTPLPILIYRTLGLYASFAGHSAQTFVSSLGADVDALCRELAREEAWEDVRSPYFDVVDADLNRWPAPWLFAWTCALGVPRAEADRIGGFDESFLNWGAEDIEFAGRLQLAGARFEAVTDACALHLPHETSSPAEMHRQHVVNSQKMHDKLRLRESELFLQSGDGLVVNHLCHRLDHLDLRMLVPDWPAKAWSTCRELIEQRPSSLCMGFASLERLGKAAPAVALGHNRSACARLALDSPATEVRCGLGTRLHDTDAAFASVLIGDLVRLLPVSLQRAVFAEARRVGEVVYSFASRRPGRAPRVEAAGWGWSSPAELLANAERAGLECARELDQAGARVFELRPRALSRKPEAAAALAGTGHPSAEEA